MYIRTYSTRNITNVSILIDSEEAHFFINFVREKHRTTYAFTSDPRSAHMFLNYVVCSA